MFNLPDIYYLFAITSGVLAFFFQFGALWFKINSALQEINDKLQIAIHNTEVNLQTLKADLIATELRISENYLKKDSFHLVIDKIDNHLVRLEAKLDAAIASK